MTVIHTIMMIIPLQVRLEGTTIKQPGQILNTALHVYFNKATGG
jgi:hypothetical protein